MKLERRTHERLINDAFAKAVAERPRRFRALATLPLNDPAASARELERSVRDLGFRGAMVLSNVNGIPLSDPRFLPIYEKADELGAILYIHPTYPAAAEGMTDYRLTALILAGSDYPQKIGSLDKMVTSIDALGVSPSEADAIASGNASRLLG